MFITMVFFGTDFAKRRVQTHHKMSSSSLATTLMRSLGKSALDKAFTIVLLILSIATGLGAKLLVVGFAQSALTFIAILSAFIVVAVLYFNHHLLNLAHEIAEIRDNGRRLAGTFTDHRTQQTLELNTTKSEIMEYLQVVGLINHYRVQQEDRRTMALDKEERLRRFLMEEQGVIEQWMLQIDPNLSPNKIRTMTNVFYEQA